MEENNRTTHEHLTVTKPDIEHNVTRILKLIKNGGQGKKWKIQKDGKKEAELVGLVEDFYQRYRSLHSLYDHLKRDSEERVIPATETEKPSSSTPSSDSEYFSSEEFNSNNSGLDCNDQTVDKSSKQEVGSRNSVEIRDLKLEVNSLRDLKIEMAKQLVERNQELESTHREKDELDQRKNQEVSEILKLVEGLTDKVAEKTKEAQREQEGKAGCLARITELEMEVESLLDQKNESEEKLNEINRLKEEEKLTEEHRKQEQKEEFLARITELEIQLESLLKQGNKSEEKLNEINSLKEEEESMTEQRKQEEKEGFLTRITELEMEVESLREQRNKSEEKLNKVNTKKEEEESMAEQRKQEEKEWLLTRITELEMEMGSLVDERNKSEEKLNEINRLKEEEESMAEQRKQGEKEGFLARIEELEMQVESLLEQQRNQSEEKVDEINQRKEEEKSTEELRKQDEKEGFLARITELEMEVASLLDQRTKSEEKLDEMNRLKEAENEKLQKKYSELERLLANKGDDLSSLKKSYLSKEVEASTQITQLVKHVQSLKEVLDSLEDRKRKEKQEFSQRICQVENEKTKLNNKISDQHKKLKEQEEMIEKWRKESKESKTLVAERKMGEMAEDFRKKVETNIRILYQRILVAEQLQAETKNSYRKRDISYEQEIQALLKKFIPEIGEKMDQTAHNFEEQTGTILNQIFRSSNELQTAKLRIAELKNELSRLSAVVNEKKEQELQLREMVWKLEANVSKEGGEKLNLMNDMAKQERKVGELEKKVREKEEGLVRVAEEKREAIRQLCIFIDYHRSSYDQLREVFFKNNLKK